MFDLLQEEHIYFYLNANIELLIAITNTTKYLQLYRK